MSDKEALILSVNGQNRSADAEPGDTLLTVLRDNLHILSPKRGCNQGVCGACTVLIDDMPQRSCLSLAASCQGKTIRTVDGLSEDETMQDLQVSFREHGAVQCGFCTSGMIISAWHLLKSEDNPGRDDIRSGLSGNLCRCTGYQKIIDSVAAVAEGRNNDRR